MSLALREENVFITLWILNLTGKPICTQDSTHNEML